jgi:dCMP deaminase
MSRLSWREYAAELAKTAALRSEDPHRKVGACALAEDGKVLALGYNGLASGKSIAPWSRDSFWADRDARRPFVIHAEANCLSMIKSGQCHILATTLLPCSYCATMIAAYKIPRVVYLEEYDRDSKAHEIFKFYGISLDKI